MCLPWLCRTEDGLVPSGSHPAEEGGCQERPEGWSAEGQGAEGESRGQAAAMRHVLRASPSDLDLSAGCGGVMLYIPLCCHCVSLQGVHFAPE